jgi:hypothetical protein
VFRLSRILVKLERNLPNHRQYHDDDGQGWSAPAWPFSPSWCESAS